MKVLTVFKGLWNFKCNTEKNSQSKINNQTKEYWNNFVPIEEFDWKDIEDGWIMYLEIFSCMLLSKLCLRTCFLFGIIFFNDHLLRFLDNRSVKCTIVILHIPFCLHLHLHLTQVHRQTYFEQILNNSSFSFWINPFLLNWMLFNLE